MMNRYYSPMGSSVPGTNGYMINKYPQYFRNNHENDWRGSDCNTGVSAEQCKNKAWDCINYDELSETLCHAACVFTVKCDTASAVEVCQELSDRSKDLEFNPVGCCDICGELLYNSY